MVRYSLSSDEHEIKRGLRTIQREIKQGVFVDIPMDYEGIFDNEFYVKLSNCKTHEEKDNWLIINGDPVELKEGDVNRHEYDDGNVLYYLSSSELKEALERFSITLAEDLRKILLAVLPTSARIEALDDYISNQYKFF